VGQGQKLTAAGHGKTLPPEEGLQTMRKWECVVCGFIYDEAQGLPEEGIAPGTSWEDIPDDWECPECGMAKADFEMVPV
jgi:rubredoxin